MTMFVGYDEVLNNIQISFASETTGYCSGCFSKKATTFSFSSKVMDAKTTSVLFLYVL